MIRAAIYGATGYGGAELLRLLLAHPHVEVVQATSREAGRRLDEIHPGLRGLTELRLTESQPEGLAPDLDAVFLALPHGESGAIAPQVLKQCSDARVFDLAQDFRTGYEDEGWVYGQPELFREQLLAARRIACPGCFATAILLGTGPAIAAGFPLQRVIVDAKTGSSGSGAVPKPLTHHPARVGTIKAYKVFDHQHEIEIEASWKRLRDQMPDDERPAGSPILHFVPQSAANVRGIYACCYLMPASRGALDLQGTYEAFYEDARFVQVVDAPPNVLDVRGTNNAAIYIKEDNGVGLVISAIDNLCRGAAGQAVQAMNLVFEFEEDAGLRLAALNP